MENNSEQNSFKRAAGPVALTALLVAAFAIASYSHTLGYLFQFDDHLYVIDYSRNNAFADFWPPYGTRYVTYLSFALNYLLGGISTVGYHLTNLLIHIANGLLVCLLAVLTLKTPLMKKAGSAALPRLHIGILAALVFTSHPVQTEAITYISQRFASLATFFYLLAITLYLVWRMGGGGRKRAFAYALSLAFAVIAQKTKEISFTLPFMIVFFELAFFEGPLRSARRFLPLLPFISALAIIPLTIFGLDMGLWGGADARAAIGAYNEAITVNPAYEDAHYNLAWTYHSTGDNRGAVLHYSQVIRLNPSSADAYYNLGRVLSEEGMYAEAAERFRAALSINPGFADARTGLRRST